MDMDSAVKSASVKAPKRAQDVHANLEVPDANVEADAGLDAYQKFNPSVLEGIAQSQAEIIRGFPLASLTGVSDVATHLAPLYPHRLSALPAIPVRRSASAPRPTSLSGRSTLDDDPLFGDYAREVSLLAGPSRQKDPTVRSVDWNALKASASSSFMQAEPFLENISWKDPPFVNPPNVGVPEPFMPFNIANIKRADPSASKSFAIKLLDDARVPYPSPASHSQPTVGTVPPALFTGPTSTQQSTDRAAASRTPSYVESKAVFDRILAEQRAKQSVAVTLPATPKAGKDDNRTDPTTHVPIASTSGTQDLPRPKAVKDCKVISPTSYISSSPDPLSFPKARVSQIASRNNSGSPSWVVEIAVPSKPKKQKSHLRPTIANGDGHGPFSDFTSEADAVAPSVRNGDLAISSSAQRSSPDDKSRVQSPTKVGPLQPKAQVEDQLLRKLGDLIDRIVDAEDSLSPEFFVAANASLPTSDQCWLLRANWMRRLNKAVRELTKSQTGRKLYEGHMDVDQVAQLLRILKQGIDVAEAVIVFPGSRQPPSSSTKSPSKTPKKSRTNGSRDSMSPETPSSAPPKARRRSTRSATPASYREDDEDAMYSDKSSSDVREEEEQASQSTPSRSKLGKRDSGTALSKGQPKKKKARRSDHGEDGEYGLVSWNENQQSQVETNLDTLNQGIQAFETILVLLTGGDLPQELYTEDYTDAGFRMLKSQLANVIYPALDPERSPHLAALDSARITQALSTTLSAACAAFSEIAALLRQKEASERTVINSVYVAIAPFFNEQAVKGRSKELSGALEMKVLRNHSLSLLRTIFARHPSQRQWIIEEVLSSITKLPELAKRKPQYMLYNGQAIQAISALLLHLVQSCTWGVRRRVQTNLRNAEVQATCLESSNDAQEKKPGEIADVTLESAVHAVDPALEAAWQCGGAIINYLVKRSGKATKNATASEAEYKAVLEHLIRDLLVVVNLPEWPVSSLMLQIAVKAMTGVLDDTKVSADVNTAKGISLEHLGSIGATMFKLAIAATTNDAQPCLIPITQILRQQDRKALRSLARTEEAFITELLAGTADIEDAESAVDFATARWGGELLQAMRLLQTLDDGYRAKFERELHASHSVLWQIQSTSTNFHSSIERNRQALEEHLTKLAPVHGLCQARQAVLGHVLAACEGSVIAFRQKALKALATIVEVDPSVFLQDEVRVAVEKRLMDSSPSVRDAALEMLGRYVVYRPELAASYLAKIGDRITDAGLAVRKRVLKLLKNIYATMHEPEQKADICRRLVGRVYDEDDGVKDMAIVAVEELFFAAAAGNAVGEDSGPQSTSSRRRAILESGRVLIAVAGEFRDKPHPLEDLLHSLVAKYASKKTDSAKAHLATIMARLRELVEVLIDTLVDQTRHAEINLVHCVKTIYILLCPAPDTLGPNRANLLLPYLKSASTADEQTTVEYLAKIYALILPSLPRSASNLTQRLQDSLRSLLNRPTAIGYQALPDVVACFCSTVIHQTEDFEKLCHVFQTCYVKLQEGVQKLQDHQKPLTSDARTTLHRTLPILARLVSLFCQYANFDNLRSSSEDAAIYIDRISENSIRDQVYKQMVELYNLSAGTPLHGTALQCLGYLYRANPMYMLEERSTGIMDQIFLSRSAEAKSVLLRIICDFLLAQTLSDTHDDEQSDNVGGVDMRLLTGNTDNFADSGVSSAVIQRYLHHILDAAVTPSSSPVLLRPALEAVGFTVKQGLAHPMQCLPVLVALETSLDQNIAAKAFSLHSHLHEKHSTLINTRISESISKVIEYQTGTQSLSQCSGYRGSPPTALLWRWYALMREKRQWRQEFLKSFLRGLQIDPTASEYSQAGVDIARFTAENLATFDYKTMEEILFVVKSLTMLLSLAGMQIYHQMQREERLDMEVDGQDGRQTIPVATARKSVTLGFVFCLRTHLKAMYGLTDQKLNKYAQGKKSSAGDRPAISKGGEKAELLYDGMPFARETISTEDDIAEQCQAYIRLIDSDGSIREAEGNMDSDENDA